MILEFQVAQVSNSGQTLIQFLEKSGSEDGTSCESFLLEQQLKTHIVHGTLPADKEAAQNAVAQGFSFNNVLYFVDPKRGGRQPLYTQDSSLQRQQHPCTS